MCKNTIISRMTETIHEKRDQKSRCVSEDITSSLISKNEKQERGIIMKRMKKNCQSFTGAGHGIDYDNNCFCSTGRDTDRWNNYN